MGTFRVKIEVGDADGERWESVDALVDTGASFTVVPASILPRAGVFPRERWPFELADGRTVEKEIGDARVRVNGRTAPTLVVFGDETPEALLGAHSLQGLLLAPDPINHRLIPVPGLLKIVKVRGIERNP